MSDTTRVQCVGCDDGTYLRLAEILASSKLSIERAQPPELTDPRAATDWRRILLVDIGVLSQTDSALAESIRAGGLGMPTIYIARRSQTDMMVLSQLPPGDGCLFRPLDDYEVAATVQAAERKLHRWQRTLATAAAEPVADRVSRSVPLDLQGSGPAVDVAAGPTSEFGAQSCGFSTGHSV